MNILLYAGIYKNLGTGNVLRLLYFYDYLAQKGIKVDFTSNDSDLANKVINSIDNKKNIVTEKHRGNYDCIIYDSSKIDNNVLKKLAKKTNLLIALDFFEYNNQYINIIINLFNHKSGYEIKSFNGKIYSGLNYSILKPEILKKKIDIFKNPNKPKVLVTFGGEDPKSNTLTVLKKLKDRNIEGSIILGYLNQDRKKIINEFSEVFNILSPVSNIGDYFRQNDIIICGGGTTLLEAIYIGNPIIALPQNKREKKFIKYIKNNIDIFNLNDVNKLLDKFNNYEFRTETRNQYQNFIDGKGKKRILDIIKENI